MNITTLDYAIMGLLLGQNLTGYKVRMAFETSAIGNFSSSPGSIYPAIKKLKKLELIQEASKSDKMLKITAAGKEQMYHWLTKDIRLDEVAKRSDILVLKFAFMDHLVSKQDKETFINSLLTITQTYINELEAYMEDEGHQLPLHGRLALDHGVRSFKAQLAWAKSTLKIIEDEG